MDVSIAALASVDRSFRAVSGGPVQASRTPFLRRTDDSRLRLPAGDKFKKPCAPDPSMQEARIVSTLASCQVAHTIPLARAARTIASTRGRSGSGHQFLIVMSRRRESGDRTPSLACSSAATACRTVGSASRTSNTAASRADGFAERACSIAIKARASAGMACPVSASKPATRNGSPPHSVATSSSTEVKSGSVASGTKSSQHCVIAIFKSAEAAMPA